MSRKNPVEKFHKLKFSNELKAHAHRKVGVGKGQLKLNRPCLTLSSCFSIDLLEIETGTTSCRLRPTGGLSFFVVWTVAVCKVEEAASLTPNEIDETRRMLRVKTAALLANWIARTPGSVYTLTWALTVGILIACFWPFHTPRNAPVWIGDQNGLRFRGHGLALSATSLPFPDEKDDGAVSLEIWLEAANTSDSGTIVSFYDAQVPRRFSVAQSNSDLKLELKGPGRGRGDRTRFYLGDLFATKKPMLIGVTSDSRQTSVFVNGALTASSRFPLAARNCHGQVLLGNSPDHNCWSGAIYGLAVYSRLLTGEEMRRHYAEWTAQGRPQLSSSPNDLALYLFRERTGRTVHNELARGADLDIPERFSVPDPPFLSPPTLDNPGDILANIAGFIPAGFLFYACLSRRLNSRQAAFYAILAGAVMSLLIESLQFYLPTRDSDLTDVISNTLGSVIGVLLCRTSFANAVLSRLP